MAERAYTLQRKTLDDSGRYGWADVDSCPVTDTNLAETKDWVRQARFDYRLVEHRDGKQLIVFQPHV